MWIFLRLVDHPSRLGEVRFPGERFLRLATAGTGDNVLDRCWVGSQVGWLLFGAG